MTRIDDEYEISETWAEALDIFNRTVWPEMQVQGLQSKDVGFQTFVLETSNNDLIDRLESIGKSFLVLAEEIGRAL